MCDIVKNSCVRICRAFLIAMLISAGGLAGEVKVTGTVYEDANGNGCRDAAEKGMPGACVSDGEHVVKTDSGGRYAISVTNDVPSWVCVTQPGGYRLTTPFYMLVSGEKMSPADFGMQADAASADTKFTFIHFADIQYDIADDVEQLRYDFDMMERLADKYDVRFYTCVGDLTPKGAPADLNAIKKGASTFRRTFYPQFGGHDGLTKTARTAMGNYVEAMGPYDYSWDYGGVHFIALVSELGFLSPKQRERQFRWLKADLAAQLADKPLIILCHTPGELSKELADIARTRRLLAVLQGHWHVHNLFMVRDIAVFDSSPVRPLDWGAFTKRCRMITVDNGKISSRTRVLGQEERIVVLSPQGEISRRDNLPVAANVYDTVTIPDKVTCSITGDAREEFSCELHAQSDWTWTTSSPLQLPAGKYRIEITASAGEKKWSQQSSFEVVAKAVPCELDWIYSTGASLPWFSSPAVCAGRVYLGLGDGDAGNQNSGVICLDAATGKSIWRARLPGDIRGSVCADGRGVYAFSGRSGELYCLSASTGKTIWRSNIYKGTEFAPDALSWQWRMALSPLALRDGRIYVTAAGCFVACCDARTGRRIWRNRNFAGFYSVGGVGVGKKLGVAVNEDQYIGLDLKTGERVWKQNLKPRQRGCSTPLVDGDAVYIHCAQKLIKAAVSTGDVIWQAELPDRFNYTTTPAVASGKVIISGCNAVCAFDAATGKPLWEFKTRTPQAAELGKYQEMLNGSSPAVRGGNVFVGGDDGYFYVLDLSTGRKKWEYHIGTPVKASPAVAGDRVFVSAFDGNVYAFIISGDGSQN